METITNAAATVTSTVSNLIYGQTTKENETAGQEPISGEQGKGTVNDPFDKGNAENPADASSSANTKSDEFLKLNPEVGKATTTESSINAKTDAAGDSAMPVIPLNPDAATSNTASPSATGVTDKAGVTDKTWKPTELDQVKPEGPPGAGPTAPDVTPAAGETEQHSADAAKDNKATETAQASSDTKKTSTGNDQIDAILHGTPKAEHSVPEAEANDPHSKMEGKTTRQADASKSAEGGEAKDLAAANTGRKSESGKRADSPNSNDEKGGGKMSHLKDKLKDKLHIGSKDK